MTDPEPSDSGYPVPVNRIALLSRYGVIDMVGAPLSAAYPDALGQVLDLDSPPGMIDIVPALARATRPEYDLRSDYDLCSLSQGPNYQGLYNYVRDQIRSGRSADEVRARLLPMIPGSGEIADAMREAVEAALAGRPPKYEGPPEP